MNRGVALTLKELVVDHVHTTLEPEDWQWQPSLKEALEDLTAEQAAWKPAPLAKDRPRAPAERHSIWQIVRHLILWKRGVLDAWNGIPADPEQLAESDWQQVAGSEADWDRDRRTLLEISTQFLTRAQHLDDRALSKQIVWYKGGATQPLAVRVVRTTTHDVYHAGQIRYLRALQGIPG
jgi:uncharacterized damage-inducible protein DinB